MGADVVLLPYQNYPKRHKTMANNSAAVRIIHFTTAACLFVTYTRDAEKIGKVLNTTGRTIRRYAETEDWEDVLQILNYEGERNFRVRPRRG